MTDRKHSRSFFLNYFNVKKLTYEKRATYSLNMTVNGGGGDSREYHIITEEKIRLII